MPRKEKAAERRRTFAEGNVDIDYVICQECHSPQLSITAQHVKRCSGGSIKNMRAYRTKYPHASTMPSKLLERKQAMGHQYLNEEVRAQGRAVWQKTDSPQKRREALKKSAGLMRVRGQIRREKGLNKAKSELRRKGYKTLGDLIQDSKYVLLKPTLFAALSSGRLGGVKIIVEGIEYWGTNMREIEKAISSKKMKKPALKKKFF